MQVYLTKPMVRFARRQQIAHAALREAITRAEHGLIDADLGGGLIEQRVARPGKGRSGGYRTIIAYRRSGRAVFLYGFAKSERGNIRQDELTALRIIGSNWLNASFEVIAEAVDRNESRRGDGMTNRKKPTPLVEALLEMAADQHRIGIMDGATYRKITVRHLGKKAQSISAAPISPKEIRAIRQRANLSQAALASMMNLTVGYLSQLERGVKQPKGPSLALLNVIRRRGIEVIL